ncbi:hypothetical protein EJ110_NYTH37196 [Nymphaea thermarum]|nr:hypothetical protein EJ110_NYTH37196 [Nymphaea thermarum]
MRSESMKDEELRASLVYLDTKSSKHIVVLFLSTIETFEWLIKDFTKAMNVKHPKVVLTDDNNAIAAAMSHGAKSMHVALRVKSYLSMYRFIEQYELFVNSLRHNELDEDVKSYNSRPITLSINMLAKAITMYTPTTFEWFKQKTIQETNCSI